MNITLLTVTALMAAVTVAAILWIILSVPQQGGGAHDDVTVTYDHGNIPVVTVRSAGGHTVTVRTAPPPYVLDEDDETDLVPVGPEAARAEFPELYDEYMAEGTSAIRRYEIADYICDAGYVLPYRRGLHEEYRRELEAAAAAAETDGGTPSPQEEAGEAAGQDPVVPAAEPEEAPGDSQEPSAEPPRTMRTSERLRNLGYSAFTKGA